MSIDELFISMMLHVIHRGRNITKNVQKEVWTRRMDALPRASYGLDVWMRYLGLPSYRYSMILDTFTQLATMSIAKFEDQPVSRTLDNHLKALPNKIKLFIYRRSCIPLKGVI